MPPLRENNFMSILKITNLTDDPEETIRGKIDNAIEEYERDNSIILTESQKNACHEYVENMVEDFEENGKVSEAMSFVDNLIVNFDYYSLVEEIYKN